MTGKTHLVLGESAALLLLQPASLKEITLCMGAAAVGSAICDIDVTSSKSHRELTRILTIAAIAAVGAVLVEATMQVGILSMLQRQVTLWKAVCGGGMLLLICAVGMRLPHRTLMHSLPCWLVVTAILRQTAPPLADAFSVAMLSHILLDLLNHKPVYLLYPLKKGLCLDLCPADGKVDYMLFRMGSILWLAALMFCAKSLAFGRLILLL